MVSQSLLMNYLDKIQSLIFFLECLTKNIFLYYCDGYKKRFTYKDRAVHAKVCTIGASVSTQTDDKD